MSLSEEFQNMRINHGRRPPLSVDDLSDPSATPARKMSGSSVKNEQARFLVKAFEDFILPIVHAEGSGLGAANRRANGEPIERGTAAKQLIDALENFITSLVRSEVIRNDGAQREEVSDIRENTGLIPYIKPPIYRTQPRSVIFASKAPEQPRLLKLALEAARHRVFNMMPIRLLLFKFDGSGIKLLDRSATWDHVSTLIKAGFDEDQMNQDIQRRNYPTHNPAAEKEAIEQYISLHTRYAILSHTWLHDKPGEVTYGEWKDGSFDADSLGYQKLVNFCRIAATTYGNTLAWMDTICINKDSSAELDESIRSMFKWYRDASTCITYLAQTTSLAEMANDAWFTRGWTLQELLAPQYIKFYGTDWQRINSDLENDKQNYLIQTKILVATTITPVELNNPNIASVSRAMQWAANRRVTREEDTAYSLMGIFDVSMSIAYGEGAERAFFRLAHQILNSKGQMLDVINWGYGPDLMHVVDDTRLSSLIPSRPQQYLWRAANISVWPRPSIPITLTHLGLHLSVLLMPAVLAVDPALYPTYPIGDYHGAVNLDEAVSGLDVDFAPPGLYNVLDRAILNNTDNSVAHRHQITFGVLNFTTNESVVGFSTANPITCFAVALCFDPTKHPSLTEAAAAKRVQVIRTRTAISFDLHSRQSMGSPSNTWSFIPKIDLAQHGMQLLDMYL